ncbi:MFS transporter [Metallosphaera hakonensis]|uniref:MFS transporter n=1 Tax=Metallosphaera hakonensis JCM 8857 = DSM 7519 TaxID=1293036 RepID=A0A2U9IRI1_9CREN|nr:MFS transporter [Metallosphaera hakonensis]AWR98632.1 hypothetical protein DFR87_01725 [Metallosphaera hakonensis JCM 8857 = DSM 7519]
MSSPLDYPGYRRFLINNALTSAVYPWSEMTVMWLFYQNLHSLLLFSLVASSRVIVRIVGSPIAGWLGDRYDRGKILFVTKSTFPFILTTLALLMAFHQYLIGIAVVFIRAFISEISALTGSVSIVTLVPREMMSRAIFINRMIKEPSTLVTTLTWPLMFNLLGPYLLLVSATTLAVALPFVYGLKVSGGKKNVSLLTGLRIFASKQEVRGAILGIVVDQMAFAFLLYYTPLMVTLEGGSEIFYSLANAAFALGAVLGSYLVTKIKSSAIADIINLAVKVSLFPPLLFHNPWSLVYSMFAITFADMHLEIVWFRSLRTGATDDYLSSVIGLDDTLTNLGRTGALEIFPFLLSDGLYTAVGLGLILIGVEGIIHLTHKSMLEFDS